MLEMISVGCGQGDTTLICVNGCDWFLVDCNLPQGAIRDHFFEIVKDRGIETLAGLFLTHADVDHFRGMESVVEYFTAGARRIQMYCDTCAVSLKDVSALLENDGNPYRSAHRALQDLIDLKLREGTIAKYLPLLENSREISCAAGRVKIVPIGPSPEIVRYFARSYLTTAAFLKSLNAISLVIVVEADEAGAATAMLLAGDADENSLRVALAAWVERRGDAFQTFSAVKVPHHGSIDSHYPPLCKMRQEGQGIAVISVGATFPTHPDRAVLEAFHKGGWRLLSTMKRHVPPRARPRGRVLLTSARAGATVRFSACDVITRWSAKNGLTSEPASAEILAAEFSLYSTALR
jgi:beta-lactamase superfamily II metal-dependent hydrolase